MKDSQARWRLCQSAEMAKIELSFLTHTSISIPFITSNARGPKHIDTKLSRAKFEELCGDLLDRYRALVEDTLKGANLSHTDLDEVVLLGGLSRVPAVIELVRKLTKRDPKFTLFPEEEGTWQRRSRWEWGWGVADECGMGRV